MSRHKYLCLVLYIFIQIVNLTSCEDGSSLAFAIDDTRSMHDDIDQVKKQAKELMKIVTSSNATNIKDMVLVTINDPDVILRAKTKSPDLFISELNKIKEHNIYNADCPEMALGGVEKALLASRQGSYIYVFTDASAKDYHKVDKIKNLCQKKQSQVIFVLTGDCYNTKSVRYRVYFEVAEACSGQVFRVNKDDVGSILDVVKVLVRATTSVFKWVNVPPSYPYVKVPFQLDEKAEYALVSTSGKNVQLKVTTKPRYHSPEPEHKVILSIKNSKTIELVNPRPGTYYAWVRGDSAVSVVVYGRTDFTFDYGFSILEPKSLNDATKQPIAGAKQHVSITVNDPDHSVEIQTLQILDIKRRDAVITELPLRDNGNGFYITDPFVSPTSTFRIAVKGKIKRTNQPIIRNSRTNINPMFVDLTPESAPVVDISEGSSVDAMYGADVTLTCNVRAHPRPDISWYTAAGALIPTQSSEKSKPEYISYLKLSQLKTGEKYICRAGNRLGYGEKSIQINIKPALKPNPKGSESASLGSDQKLTCGITSHLPITRKWYKADEEITQSRHYSIASDGSELTLKPVSVGLQGTYTCVATLNSDPTVRESRTIEVVIPGLASPKIKPTNRNINVKEGEKFALDCGISSGYPKPKVQWVKVRPGGSQIPADSEVLTVDRSTFQHAGQYKCIVTNPMGTTSATFDVTITIPPKVVVKETAVTVPYNSAKTLFCEGEAYPPPTVEWRDEHGNRVAQQQIRPSSDYQFENTLKLENLRRNGIYTCVVRNTDGAVNDKVSITVLSPLRKNTNTNANISPGFGDDAKIVCDISSDWPITIKWYKAGKEITQSDHYSISHDGSELILKSVSVDMQGSYTCKAALNTDPIVNDSQTTEVVIPGLVSPKIKPTNRNINVKEGEKFALDCGISSGYPKPKVQWVKVRPGGSQIPADSEVLTVDRSTFQHAGQYKCIVTNPLGTTSATFDVTITIPPKVVVKETAVTLPYNSAKTLVCEGEAYPPPTVEWRDEHGNRVAQQQIRPSSDYQFENTLKLENLRRNGIYTCVVRNTDGAVNDKVSITVLSPLRKNTNTNANISPGFADDAKIVCDISSYWPITIKWYKAGIEITQSDDHYSISNDGSELILKSMSVDMQGSYTCKAALNTDPIVNDSQTTEVVIPGLVSPKVKPTNRNINVKEGEKFALDCGLSAGYPKPKVQWVKVRPDGSQIPADSEVLTVDRSTFQHAGQYKCIVTNPMGTTSATFDVTITIPPKVVVKETAVTLPYNSAKTLVCEGEAYPPPTVEWRDEHGNRVAQQQIRPSSDYQFENTLKLENLRRNGIYTCVVRNTDGAVNDKVSITVLSPLRKNTNTNANISPGFGDDAKIVCDISSDWPITIKWYKAGKEITQSDHYSISHDGSELILKSVSVDMQGSYTCKAALNTDPIVNDSQTTEVVIPGLVSPKIKPTNRNINVKEGEKFALDCGISSGYPKPKVQWVKVRPGGSQIPADSEVLTVDRSTFQHAGQYKCIVTNPLGTTSATFDVTITIPPKVVVKETAVTLPYNSAKTLVCEGEAYPPPTVEWRDEHGNRVAQQQIRPSSDYQFENTLKLENLRRNGIYTCVVRNTDGAVNDKVSITVLSPLRKNTNTNANISPGFADDAKIVCDISSYWPITIKWYKAGIEITQSDDHYSISNDGSELILKSMSVDMQGSYTCKAALNTDPIVNDSQTTEVVIPGLVSPKVKPTNRNINVKEGEKFALDCGLSAGYPKPKVQWVKVRPDGSQIPADSEVLTVDRSTFQHAGQYKCIVTNPMGTTSATFDVTITIPPKVVVKETAVTLPYNSAKTLVCEGEAYPPPTVEWRDEHGNRVAQQQIRPSSDYQFENTLKLENLRRNGIYTCVVRNTDGAVNDKVIITVLSPLRKNTNTNADISPGFGDDAKIVCDISSDWPITIKWYKAGIEITQSDHYSISNDGSELILKSVSVDMQGSYTCKAALNTDPIVNDSQTTEVVIPGLVSPKVKLTNRNINVKEGEKFALDCGLSAGYPKPKVQWVKVRLDGSQIPADSEVLTVDRSTFQHAGQYKCIVTNPMGTTSATFDVSVTGPPKISVDENTKSVEYNSGTDLTCKGEGYPAPTIQWTDEKGQTLPQQKKTISKYQFTSILQLEHLRKNAVYICVVSNTEGAVSHKVSVTVLSPFKIDNHVKGTTAIQYGASHTLNCDIKSKEPMGITWYMQRTGAKSAKHIIMSSDKYNVSRDGTALTIKSMDLNMDGQYTCEASLKADTNEKVTYTTNVNVVGLSAPEITPTSIVDRKNFTAICRVTGVPPPTVSWQYKPKGADVFRNILESGQKLNMPDMKLSDSGVYKCIAKNSLGEVHNNFNVNVEEEPIMTNTVNEYFALEGDLVLKVTCNVTGYPEPTITWRKENAVLTSDMKNIIKGGTIYIKNPVISDTGDYVCEATNKLGSNTETFAVVVESNFSGDDDHYIGKTRDIIGEQGQSLYIECDLKDSKIESIRWYKDGYLTKQRGNLYTIDKVSSSEDGNYTCRANTAEGSTSATYVVYMGYPPIFDDDTSPVAITWEDSQQILDCTADAQPPAKYAWFHNGQLMTAGYNMIQKRIIDWGDYTCNVFNEIGSIQKKFKVVTDGCFVTNTLGYTNQPLATDEHLPAWKYFMSNSGIKLKENEEIKFSCPRNTKTANSFKIAPNKQEIIAKCITQDKFSVAGKTYKYSELQCEHRVEASVEATGEQCAGNRSKMVRVGFPVNGYLEVYDVCYDKLNNVPIYVNTSAPALTMGSGADTAHLEWSSTPELGEHTSGDWKPAGACQCCYTKEALLDTNELPFGPAQAATFKNNLNSVAVWNPTCDGGDDSRMSWQSVNKELREISQLYEKVSTWTGASEYTYIDGRLVPRYLWKVAALDGHAAVLVYVNVRAPHASDVRCSAPCDALVPPDRGLYCCDPADFQDKFHVPIHIDEEIY